MAVGYFKNGHFRQDLSFLYFVQISQTDRYFEICSNKKPEWLGLVDYFAFGTKKPTLIDQF